MVEPTDGQALTFERSCSLTAVALSDRRRNGVRLITGSDRVFSLSSALDFVYVPYPQSNRDWTRTTVTCGVALQCSPTKERVLGYRLDTLSARELAALSVIEGRVALGWVAATWPGLMAELQRVLTGWAPLPAELSGGEILERAIALSRTRRPLEHHPLIGTLPRRHTTPQHAADRLRRSLGRMPWTTNQKRKPGAHTVPAGGDGGVRNPNLPPPSRPHENDLDITPQHRPGIPYPEWNAWNEAFLTESCCRDRTFTLNKI